MMSSLQSKDNTHTTTNNANNNTNNPNRDNRRKSKNLHLSQKLRGIGKDLRLRRISVDNNNNNNINGGGKQQRRESIPQQPSPQEDEEYRIVHTPDRPSRFVSPIEAPTEDGCYEAIRSWQRGAVAERERERSGSGIQPHHHQQHQQKSVGGERTDTEEGPRDSERSSGHFVPDDPQDDLRTPKDGAKWWELQDIKTGAQEVGGGMNPFRREWEKHGHGGQQQQQQEQEAQEVQRQPGVSTMTVGQVLRQDTAKGGAIQRGNVPPNIVTDFTALLPKTYNGNESSQQNYGFNGTNYYSQPSQEEYTPSVYSPQYSPARSHSPKSLKSPVTPTPEMFPKTPTGTSWTTEATTSGNLVPVPVSNPETSTAAPETLHVNQNSQPNYTRTTIDSGSNIEPPSAAPPPGGRYFDVDEEDTPGSTSHTGNGRGLSIPSPNFPISNQTTQTQTLHSELLKLAHKQRQEQERKGSGQSGESGNSAFYSAFTSTSSRAGTPDVRPPSRRGEGQQQGQQGQQQQQQHRREQQQAGLGLGTSRTGTTTVTGTQTPATPRPNTKQKPKQTQPQPQRPKAPMIPPRGFLKDRRPYVSPSGPSSSKSPRSPAVPPKTPEKQPIFLLNGLDFIPSRPVPPIPKQAPLKPTQMKPGAKKGTTLAWMGGMGGHHDFKPSRPVPASTPTPIPAKPKNTSLANMGSMGMGGHMGGTREHMRGHMGGHIAGAMSISSLSSLTSLTGSGGSVTPARVSPPKPKPKVVFTVPPAPDCPASGSLTSRPASAGGDGGAAVAPSPASMSLPYGEGEGEGGGLFTLPATVYTGNKSKVKMPVPSPLSKFNTSQPSSSGVKYKSTSNRLLQSQQDQSHNQIQSQIQSPIQSQNQIHYQGQSESQRQEQERTQQTPSNFSEYIHPRISDPVVDYSPSSDMDSMLDDDSRFSVAMVNGVYSPGQAHTWKETMEMMGQKQERGMERQMPMQMQKPKLVRVQSQKQRREAREREREREEQGQGKTQVQKRPEVQRQVNSKPGTPHRAPPPQNPPPQGPLPQTLPPQAYQPRSTPPPQTPSPRYPVFPPQQQPQLQPQPPLQPQSQQPQHSQPAPAPALVRLPSPSPHPSRSISLLKPIYPGAPFPQYHDITPTLLPQSTSNSITHLLPQTPPSHPRLHQNQTQNQTHPITTPRQNQLSPMSFRTQSQQSQSSLRNKVDETEEGKQKQQNAPVGQQRPLSVSSIFSNSSYESLKFWKTRTETVTGMGTSSNTQGHVVPGQRERFAFSDSEDEGKEKEKRKERRGDEGHGDGLETKTGAQSGSGNGKGVVNADDYEHLIDEYAGGWRETMFFGEPEE